MHTCISYATVFVSYDVVAKKMKPPRPYCGDLYAPARARGIRRRTRISRIIISRIQSSNCLFRRWTRWIEKGPQSFSCYRPRRCVRQRRPRPTTTAPGNARRTSFYTQFTLFYRRPRRATVRSFAITIRVERRGETGLGWLLFGLFVFF